MNRILRTVVAAAALLALAPAARADSSCRHVAPAPVRVSAFEAERRDLQRDYRALEQDREQFYARWNGNRKAQRRFERWYTERREVLDRRQERLSAVAWYAPPSHRDHR